MLYTFIGAFTHDYKKARVMAKSYLFYKIMLWNIDYDKECFILRSRNDINFNYLLNMPSLCLIFNLN